MFLPTKGTLEGDVSACAIVRQGGASGHVQAVVTCEAMQQLQAGGDDHQTAVCLKHWQL